MSANTKRRATIEEYLELERTSETKHEYFNGEIRAVAGATPRHGMLVVNVLAELNLALRGTDFGSFAGSLRVHTVATREFFYPDGSVVEGTPEAPEVDRNAIINPIALVDVQRSHVSGSGHRLRAFQTIEILQDYLLIAQDRPMITHFHRVGPHQWLQTDIHDLGAVVELDSLGVTLRLEDIYREFEKYQGEP